MSKENKLIPELRFPEFENDGNWKLKNVEEFFDVGSSKRVLQKDWTNEGVPFYRTRELVSLSKNEPFGSEIYISENLYEELKAQYGVPAEGDFLVSGVGTLGISYQVKDGDKFYFKDGNVLWFKLEGDLISTYFKYCFESEHIQNQIVGQTSKSTVGTYTITNAKKTEFWYTDNPQEQQKIASCFSSLDELIAAHSDKLEALKDHKKGLMQNLFPQEGQNVPNFRFPEFEDDGEWGEFELGKIAENLDSRRVPITSNIREKGDIPYYGASGVIDYVKDYIFNEELLLISEDGANLIARVYPIAFSISGRTWVNNHAHVLKFENWYTQVLVEKYLNSKNIEDFLTGMAQPKLNRGKLDIIPLQLPKNPKEQQKIASCLSTLDELITAQAEKIEQLQQHKKGLMQGLFPKIND
jgi:type I restriction enzyme S subunit